MFLRATKRFKDDKFRAVKMVDVVIQELMIAQLLDRNERNRFGIARMRAMFDNEPHTVWNHFWCRIAGDDIRMGNCDLPFIYGVNGFNQEGDDYRQVDAEIVTKGTDFYRFAYNTGLAAFSPKFTPVKQFNVFRDRLDHRADILEHRTGNSWMRAHCWDDTTETDGAANIWATATGIHVDLTLNRFFTLKSLKRYPVLVLPHNYMITKDLFKIVTEYVRDGGVCFVEGEKFPFVKTLTDGAEAVVRARFNLPLEKGRRYFALDMRSGRRVPFDGTLEFVQRPRAVTHWLIGDEAFTAVPEYTLCRTFDFGAVKPVMLTEGAKKNLAARDGLGDFTKPLAVLLFQEPNGKGETHENLTIRRGAYRQELMSRANYKAKAFGEALTSVKVLQLRGLKEDIVEKVFAENGEALKAFLTRGGSILLDQTKTSPAATAFLKSVGVHDVNASRVTGDDYEGIANFDALGKEHELFTKPWNIYQPWVGHRMQGGVCFAKWDEKTQFAPFVVCERDSPDKKHLAAMCVCQEKVCGAGKVIFQQNDAAFTSWYEGVTYGENLLSYAFGMDFKTHKLKVQQLYGGFGTPVEFPATIRNGF